MPLELNILALMKGTQRYVYVFDDQSRRELMNHFQEQAADPALSMNWFDAVVLEQRAREQIERRAAADPSSHPWE